MCGITGILTSRGVSSDQLAEYGRRMTSVIRHRGPDDSGVWFDPSSGVMLGFRRLAIVDLSEQGHQPMVSASGRYTIIFNGEVYNHVAIRRELEGAGIGFRGHSDTEVILGSFDRWGIEQSVRRFIGMFGMAVWDAERRELSLIRDRLGIKPLFVHHQAGWISFGSELKALIAGPLFDRTIDQEALTAYLRFLYVPAPRTIFQHTIKLLPGHILTISNPSAPLPSPVPYWSVSEVARNGLESPWTGTDEEAIDELERLLTDAVRLRMQADVPLGALLSGGIDSSAVVGLMQHSSERPVKTFTIGFDQKEYNEAAHARSIAEHLGTEHVDLQLTGEDALKIVPMLGEMFDEPLADPSQIPTYLVCQLARQAVTVALSGDGGDELFSGYNRYLSGESLIHRFERWPGGVRRLSARGISVLPASLWDRVGSAAGRLFPRANTRLFGEKVHKIADLLRADSPAGMYQSLVSAWPEPARLVSRGKEPQDDVLGILGKAEYEDVPLLDRMMLADQRTYLPDDLLAKLDRASMAVSLEARVPILDHRIVELSWRLPRRLKVRDGRGKWILRQVLYRHVPPNLVDREKMGFSVPLTKWLTGPLRDWARDLLLGPSASGGVFDTLELRRAWAQFDGGNHRRAAGIWALLMFQAWAAHWMGGTSQTIGDTNAKVSTVA
jgi:asparagine synthase (glutamine-hydrolysing)